MPDLQKLLKVFEDGYTETTKHYTLTIRIHDAGTLHLPSGKIVACDPLAGFHTTAFTRHISPGSYPIQLAVAHIHDDQRVAMARILFTPEPVARWKMALLPGQNLQSLKPGHLFGYPVDAGTGCFMDATTAAILQKQMKNNHDYFQVLIDEMEKTSVPTWNWMNFPLGRDRTHNLVSFSSGFGDGCYTSWWGLCENDRPVQLVTEFYVVPLEPE